MRVQSQFFEMFKLLPVNGTISDLTEGSPTSVKKTYSNEDMIEYIDITSIDSASKTVQETSKHFVGKAPSRAQQCVKNGDILVSTVRPVNRNVAVIDNNIPNLVASTGFCVLRPKEGYKDYILSVVTSDLFTDKMCDKASGGLYPAVNNNDVLNYGIHIPDEALANRVSVIYQQADKSKFVGFKSQFIEMFGNPVTNSKSWQTKAIMEVAPEQPSKKRMQGKVWLLNLDMIESNTGKVIEKVYETSENTLSVQPFDEGNVLFSKLRPYLNKVVVPDEYGLATTELVPLRPNQEKLHKVFLSYLLRSQQFVTFANKISGGTKMPRMPLAELRKFECILPPMSEQLKFVGITEQADKSKFELRKSIDAIDQVIKSLING